MCETLDAGCSSALNPSRFAWPLMRLETICFLSSACRSLFTVSSVASEHLKSQSKQSSNNSCCLDISSLLTKLEKKQQPVCHQSRHLTILTEQWRVILILSHVNVMKWSSTALKGNRKGKRSLVFRINLTSRRNLDVQFQLNNANIRSNPLLSDPLCSAVCKCGAGVLRASWQLRLQCAVHH